MLANSSLSIWASDPGFNGIKDVEIDSAREQSKESTLNQPTVLVVDDEELIARTMGEILRRAGFKTLIAFDGSAALELALRSNPAFVLTDVVMPKMNGVELAIAIRNALPKTEVVLLSGQAGITDILEDGHGRGYSFELIAKPVHPEKILERIRRALC